MDTTDAEIEELVHRRDLGDEIALDEIDAWIANRLEMPLVNQQSKDRSLGKRAVGVPAVLHWAPGV